MTLFSNKLSSTHNTITLFLRLHLMSVFHDPKYFSRCFKKEYNDTPKQFKQLANSEGGADFLESHDIVEE